VCTAAPSALFDAYLNDIKPAYLGNSSSSRETKEHIVSAKRINNCPLDADKGKITFGQLGSAFIE
jgi:hypothetical protein